MAKSKRKCVNCKSFSKVEAGIIAPIGFFCKEECRLEYGIKNTRKVQEKAKNERDRRYKKARMESRKNDKSYRARMAQQSFNAFIRERDRNDACVSCGRFHEGQYHAGHYRSVGAAPELRFEESNCHKQCAPCNNHLSGNIAEYRINLIKKIGLDKVEWLEGKHEPKRYTVEDFREIEKRYKEKIKALKSERNQL